MRWPRNFLNQVCHILSLSKILCLTGVLVINLIGSSTANGAEEDAFGRVPFEANDSLEMLQTKIAYNNYGFTVATNWVYNMSPEEKSRFFSRRASTSPTFDNIPYYGPLEDYLDSPPSETYFAWTNKNGHSYIGPVRDQGNCGSCYSFGACAAAEGTYNAAMDLYDGSCVDFSESFIIWCLATLPQYSSHFSGCDGADYDYYELQALCADGITYEANFPYQENNPGSCTHWNDPRVLFSSWHRVPCNDIDAIKTAIYNFGVVDVAVKVTSAFEAYSSGIYEDSNTGCNGSPCQDTTTDHAVALVGWNDNGGNGYWILRNSWGSSWGENGYMRIKYQSAAVACAVCYMVYTNASATIPIVATESATDIGSGSAKVRGSVNPKGSATTYWFEYGTTTSYGSSTPHTSAGSGSSAISVTSAVSSLSESTVYHYRIVATNAAGRSNGSDATFTTSASTPQVPTVITDPATGVLNTNATLAGRVTPNGYGTGWFFEYGLTTGYGSTTPITQAGAGTTPVSVSVAINNLTASTTYHVRMVGTNVAGRANGIDRTFTTLAAPQPPTATTDAASPVQSDAATLNATINPNGSATTYFFQYGLTTGYGSTTPSASAGSGSANVSVNRSISGLSPEVLYHFRVAASNAQGLTYGADRTFTTPEVSDTLLSEDFEHGGAAPSGWTQEYVDGSLNWDYVDGDGGYGHPSAAHGGSYNAFLYDESYDGYETILVTPVINFNTRDNNATLTFWHYMEEWCYSGMCDQDELRIYYKTSLAGSWTLLATFNANVTTWTKQSISLPNPGSTYYIGFKGSALYGYGVCIDDVEVTGSGSEPPPVPDVETMAASQIASTTARLNATVNPNGEGTGYYFQYGPDLGFGSTTPIQQAGSVTTDVPVYADISGLTVSQTYYFRVVATNTAGQSQGDTLSFTTIASALPPEVSVSAATAVGAASAILNGTVDPNGTSTDYWFEYGTNLSYGQSTAATDTGAGSSPVSVNATVNGLNPDTTYYFRVAATNQAGLVYSGSQSFNTLQQTTTLLEEDFEHGGDLPDGWTQEFVNETKSWTATTGSPDDDPSSAHSGSYNACFMRLSGVTRLVTPCIHFGSYTNNPILKFWHCMVPFYRDQDELRVYYKTSAEGTWNLLQTYDSAVNSWTLRTLSLPEPCDTYYIAFQGTAYYGYGVCIDDVSIAQQHTPDFVAMLQPPSSTNFVLNWSSATGMEYVILYSSNLMSGFNALQSNIVATPTMNVFTDSIQSIPQRFYLIEEYEP